MPESTLIFAGNQERPSSHCASITELGGGDFYAVWYAGIHEGKEGTAIVSSRLVVGSDEWSPIEVMVSKPGMPGGNPVVWDDGAGTLHHFYNIMVDPAGGWNSAELFFDTSSDGGQTWGGERIFDPEAGMMVRHRPVRLSSDRVLLPAYDEKVWEGLCYISDDNGASWRRSGRMICPAGCIQPAIIERDDSSLHALVRPGDPGLAWECDSADQGETWTPCIPSALQNPNSGADMIRLRSGEVVACFNDSPDKRSPLTIAVSLDEGRTWAGRHDLETEDARFSYPTLMQASDDTVHLVYTWKRTGIMHTRISPEWLREVAGSG